MVRPGPSSSNAAAAMGQGAVCGLNAPLTDSQPTSPISSMDTNGIASSPLNRNVADVQANLSSLSDESNVAQEDLITKLRSVVQQNLQLKEALAQNNLGLRQQLGLVVRWSQQQQQQQQLQQQQLARARVQLSTLQQHGATTNQQKDAGEDVSMLQERMPLLIHQVEQLQEDKDKLAALRAKLEADVTLLKCDLTTSRGDQERLQLERSHLINTNTELRQQLRQLHQQQQGTNSCDEVSKERARSIGLLEECEALRAEVSTLTADLNRAQQKTAHHAAAQAVAASARKDGNSSASEMQELCKVREEASLLKEDVQLLEQSLDAERGHLKEERKTNCRAANELDSLRTQLQEARDTIHRNTNTDHYYQTKIKSINEQHDGVTAKLLSYEELLSAKNEELGKLKKESGEAKARLLEVQSESDTIAVLRAQVEVYQGDFRAERQARETLASEREQLRDELRQLHARNTQLMDDLHTQHIMMGPRASSDRSRSRGGSLTPPPPPTTTAVTDGPPSSAAAQSALLDQLSLNLHSKEEEKSSSSSNNNNKEEVAPVDESLFYCPKCNKSFPQLRPLEEHVNRCLDED